MEKRLERFEKELDNFSRTMVNFAGKTDCTFKFILEIMELANITKSECGGFQEKFQHLVKEYREGVKKFEEVQDENKCETEFKSGCEDECIPTQALNAIIDFLEQVDPSTDPEKILFVIKGVLKKAVEDFKQMENNGRNDFKKRR
jgi:hypothetical protein